MHSTLSLIVPSPSQVFTKPILVFIRFVLLPKPSIQISAMSTESRKRIRNHRNVVVIAIFAPATCSINLIGDLCLHYPRLPKDHKPAPKLSDDMFTDLPSP